MGLRPRDNLPVRSPSGLRARPRLAPPLPWPVSDAKPPHVPSPLSRPLYSTLYPAHPPPRRDQNRLPSSSPPTQGANGPSWLLLGQSRRASPSLGPARDLSPVGVPKSISDRVAYMRPVHRSGNLLFGDILPLLFGKRLSRVVWVLGTPLQPRRDGVPGSVRL